MAIVKMASEDFVAGKVQSDWNQTDASAKDFIKNKPTIPAAVTVDNTVTQSGANPVKSSGIWAAIWGALTALPTGFTSLYKWCVAQLAGKYEMPVTGIPASDLAQAVQTALSEIPGKADAADLRYRIAEAEYSAFVGTAGGYILADRTVNLIAATDETNIDIELPDPVEEPTDVRRARDFFLDIDNSNNASNLALEFTALGVDYIFVVEENDSIGEMVTIGTGERVRLYFTECAIKDVPEGMGDNVPIFHVARVTLSDNIEDTQGGNS